MPEMTSTSRRQASAEFERDADLFPVQVYGSLQYLEDYSDTKEAARLRKKMEADSMFAHEEEMRRYAELGKHLGVDFQNEGHDGRGDLVVAFRVDTPAKLRDVLKKMAYYADMSRDNVELDLGEGFVFTVDDVTLQNGRGKTLPVDVNRPENFYEWKAGELSREDLGADSEREAGSRGGIGMPRKSANSGRPAHAETPERRSSSVIRPTTYREAFRVR